jgi:hypothetical protein
VAYGSFDGKVALCTLHHDTIRHYSGVAHGTGKNAEFEFPLLPNYVMEKGQAAICGDRHVTLAIPITAPNVIQGQHDARIENDRRIKYDLSGAYPILFSPLCEARRE